jgi:threonine synthase
VASATPIVTLGEGSTPLIYAHRLSDEVEADVWLKYEGLNPTGSFKDRGMTVAISKALEQGVRLVVCASTGNTSASAAAYAGRAGIPCCVIVPRGGVAAGKLSQAVVHGARVLTVDASFDRALELVASVATEHSMTLVNSTNPYRLEGQKTAAFEVVEELGRAPDVHVMPVGNAGNITAYWRGYREAVTLGWAEERPKMYGVQAKGADPIVRGSVVPDPQTVASAIRIGNPASWAGATEAAGDSGGRIVSVPDGDIMRSYISLAQEGVFVEPAAAASVAGLRKLSEEHLVAHGSTVVCVLTGHGLKDPEVALGHGAAPEAVQPDPAALLEKLRDPSHP